MSLESVVQASTANAAFAIGRLGEIGTLKPGAIADVTILKMRSGKFTLTDSYGENVRTTRRLIPTRVVRGGMLVNPPVAS
jgi:dihydroorotase